MDKSFSVTDSFAIKGIAILMMYIHHMFLGPERWGRSYVNFWPLTQNITVAIALFFKICVSLFVFISAYGLTVQYKRKKIEGSINSAFVFNHLYKLELRLWFVFFCLLLYSAVMGIGHYTKIYGSGWQSCFKCIIDGLGLAYLFKLRMFNGTWWYMSVAIIIIVSFPLFFKCYKQVGGTIVVVSWLLPIALYLTLNANGFLTYLPCIFMGIFVADNDYLNQILSKGATLNTFSNKCLVNIGLFIVIICFSVVSVGAKKVMGNYSPPIFNAIIAPMIIAYATYMLKGSILWKGLVILGKHSMNMFLIHTMIRGYWYHDFAYSFKYAWLDTLVLVILTLLVSLIIENAKRLTGYNRLVEKRWLSL